MKDWLGHTPPDFYVACHADVHNWGGGPTFVVGLQQAFRTLGYDAVVLGIDDSAQSADLRAVRDGRLNVRSGVPARLWRVRGWLLPRCMARQLTYLPPPRVAFVAVSPTWVVAARRAWPHVPVVFVFACFLTNCLPFTWPPRRRSLWQRLDLAAVRHIEQEAFASAELVLAPTQHAADEIRAFIGHSPKKLQLCAYGVRAPTGSATLRAQQRQTLGLRRDDFLVAAVGTCDRNKGFDLAVRAWPYVDPAGRLVIIGDGPERGMFERLVLQTGQADRIHFAGPQRQMAPWYAAADCVLSTSCYDTFPNVLLEGMSVGLPIVVPQHDPPQVYAGMAEVVQQHDCGLLYARSDVTALAKALNRLIRDRQWAVRLGDRGRQAVQQRHQWSAAAALILQHLGQRPQPVLPPGPGTSLPASGRSARACEIADGVPRV